MAQSAIETRNVSSVHHRELPYKAITTEYNFTSLSLFKACLVAALIVAPVWASIAYIVAQ